MPIFGANPGYQSGLPIDQIKSMRAQGMDNNQIIQALQNDGFSSTDIFDAMNQADRLPAGDFSQGGIPPPPGSGGDMGGTPPPMQEVQSNMPPPGFPSPGALGGGVPSPGGTTNFGGDVSTEELVEAIIDEKWNELVKDMQKIVEWKNSTNNKILQMEQKFSDMKSEFERLQSAIISKVEDYDKNIINVGAEVKAMEKVFSKVLPVFTENVSELSRITKDIKKTKTEGK